MTFILLASTSSQLFAQTNQINIAPRSHEIRPLVQAFIARQNSLYQASGSSLGGTVNHTGYDGLGGCLKDVIASSDSQFNISLHSGNDAIDGGYADSVRLSQDIVGAIGNHIDADTGTTTHIIVLNGEVLHDLPDRGHSIMRGINLLHQASRMTGHQIVVVQVFSPEFIEERNGEATPEAIRLPHLQSHLVILKEGEGVDQRMVDIAKGAAHQKKLSPKPGANSLHLWTGGEATRDAAFDLMLHAYELPKTQAGEAPRLTIVPHTQHLPADATARVPVNAATQSYFIWSELASDGREGQSSVVANIAMAEPDGRTVEWMQALEIMKPHLDSTGQTSLPESDPRREAIERTLPGAQPWIVQITDAAERFVNLADQVRCDARIEVAHQEAAFLDGIRGAEVATTNCVEAAKATLVEAEKTRERVEKIFSRAREGEARAREGRPRPR